MIRIQGLRKQYASSRGAVQAIRGLDLEVAAGEFLVLLGPSGCGKTTTLRCVAGLERPEHGTIEIAGTVVDSPATRVFVPPERRDLGMVFQSYAVWPHLNVFQNVALPLTQGRRKAARGEVQARVLEALRLVRLDGLEDRPVTDLSGGQQQRVSLARAIVTRPKVLLMDEPLSNLDARLRDQMRVELKRLTLQLGVTTLYVTHDQTEALGLGDRVCIMYRGAILQQGPPEEVYQRPTDPFVAQFVGDMNLVPGIVAGEDEVATPLGTLRCQLGLGLARNQAVTLGIRPEHVGLASAGKAGAISGTLVDRLFAGDAAVWHVRVGDLVLTAKVRSAERRQPGERVELSLPADRWIAFTGGDAAGTATAGAEPTSLASAALADASGLPA